MVQSTPTQLPISSMHALLFTDARGHVVFVDNNFLRLMSRAQAGGIVGAPLHRVMGIEQDVASQLLRDTSQKGSFSDRTIELHTDAGAKVRVSCSSTATYDERNSFIGADMMLTELDQMASAIDDPAARQERLAEEGAYLSVYFISVVQALRDLLEHIGGERPRARLEAIINETSNRSEWPVLIQAGKVYAEVHQNEGEVYRGLLARAVTYSAGVIGSEMVKRALTHLDTQTDATTLELAGRHGLRDLIQSQ